MFLDKLRRDSQCGYLLFCGTHFALKSSETYNLTLEKSRLLGNHRHPSVKPLWSISIIRGHLPLTRVKPPFTVLRTTVVPFYTYPNFSTYFVIYILHPKILWSTISHQAPPTRNVHFTWVHKTFQTIYGSLPSPPQSHPSQCTLIILASSLTSIVLWPTNNTQTSAIYKLTVGLPHRPLFYVTHYAFKFSKRYNLIVGASHLLGKPCHPIFYPRVGGFTKYPILSHCFMCRPPSYFFPNM